MQKMLRFVGQSVCIILVAGGLLAALFATFCLGAMAFVRTQEGALLPTDRTMIAAGVKWLLGSCLLVGAAWWLRGKIGNKTGDNSFRLESKSGRLEKLVQRVSGFSVVIWLATQLWARDPGSAFTTGAVVTGWITLGFLGCHARIAFHEMGHLAAAWLVGLSPRKIQVGVGPLLWSRACANGLLWEWRAWPNGGFVLAPERRTEGFRTRQSLYIAGGPLADLLILWTTYQLIEHAFGGLGASFSHGPGGLMCFVFFWLTAFSAIGGLLPRQVSLGPNKMWTDGYLLLRLLAGSSVAFPELAYNSKWEEPLELLGFNGSRSVIPLEVVERDSPAHRAGLITFHEQRALLSSPLLRRPSITSLPLA